MMNRLRFAVILLLLTGSLLWAAEEVAQYVGMAVCVDCHPDQEERELKENVHIKSLERLTGSERQDPACLRCHSTGHGQPQVAGVNLGGVQCEGCHGPGGKYAVEDMGDDREVDMSRGLIIPPDPINTCNDCHFPKDAKRRLPGKCPNK